MMVKVFRHSSSSVAEECLWSFSYVDWRGRPQEGIGTESRVETVLLAERVQAEHDQLRALRRKTASGKVSGLDEPQIEYLQTGHLAPPIEGEKTPNVSESLIRRNVEPESDVRSQRIGEQMVAAGVISEEDLAWALQAQYEHGGRIVEILIREGLLSPEEYLVFMGKQPGIPRIELENCIHISDSVIELIPIHMAEELDVIPTDRIGKILTVAMICPTDRNALNRLQNHTGLKVRPMLCSHAAFRTAFMRHYHRAPRGSHALGAE